MRGFGIVSTSGVGRILSPCYAPIQADLGVFGTIWRAKIWAQSRAWTSNSWINDEVSGPRSGDDTWLDIAEPDYPSVPTDFGDYEVARNDYSYERNSVYEPDAGIGPSYDSENFTGPSASLTPYYVRSLDADCYETIGWAVGAGADQRAIIVAKRYKVRIAATYNNPGNALYQGVNFEARLKSKILAPLHGCLTYHTIPLVTGRSPDGGGIYEVDASLWTQTVDTDPTEIFPANTPDSIVYKPENSEVEADAADPGESSWVGSFDYSGITPIPASGAYDGNVSYVIFWPFRRPGDLPF